MKREKAARFAGLLIWLPAVLCGWPWSASARSEETLKERHARIEGMDPTEKEELRWQLKRFSGLEPAEKERLRQLHERIEQDPRKDDLRKVMERYCQWVKTLPSYERAELRGLSPAERIERIIELRQEEERRRKDREALIAWADDYTARGAPEFMNALPKDVQEDLRRELEEAKDDPEQRRRIFGKMCWEWGKENPKTPPPLGDTTWEELRRSLSDATRKRLENMPKEEQRGFLMFRLSWVLMFSASRFAGEPPTAASKEQLADYLKNNLDPKLRERLLRLPPEQQRRWLSRLYSRSQASGKPRHFPGRGPGPRGPSGPPFGPPGDGRPELRGAPGPPPRRQHPPGKPPAEAPPPPERQD